MHARTCKFASLVLVILSIGASACEDSSVEDRTSIRMGVSAPSRFPPRFSVEPAAIRPEFIDGPLCGGLRPFRTRFDVFMQSDRDLFLRRFRFDFRDRAGRRVTPAAFLTSIGGATVHNSMPVAVPVHGSLPVHGATISPPFGRAGFVLNFDCGFLADGTLMIDIESADSDGTVEVAQVRVPVS